MKLLLQIVFVLGLVLTIVWLIVVLFLKTITIKAISSIHQTLIVLLVAAAATVRYFVLNGLNNLVLVVQRINQVLAIILLQMNIAIIISKYLQLAVMLLVVVTYINLIIVITVIGLAQKKIQQESIVQVLVK